MTSEDKEHCSGMLPPDDVLSDLPGNVIDDILVRLPLRDAVRTSILSNKWRYNWRRLPELKLDRPLWETRDKSIAPTIIFTEILYHLLTLHVGPITKLTLSIVNLGDCPKIDNLIYFLSRNGIEHLVLQLSKKYKLPSSFFKCLKLRHLRLHNCSFHPPSFIGFNELVSLELYKVRISSELLESLISRSPLLEKLVLRISSILSCTQINAPKLRSFDFEGRLEFISLKKAPLVKLSIVDTGDYVSAGNPDLAKCLESFTALEHLHLNYCSVQFLVEGSGHIPAKLSPPLNCLKRLCLSNICLDELFELKCALCWIRSSPHIEDIHMEIDYESSSHSPVRGDAGNDIPASFSDVTLNHLRAVKFEGFTGTRPQMELIKILLAKSPVLVRMVIIQAKLEYESSETRLNVLTEITKFQRASQKAAVDYSVE